jgi:RNA polymerase sigma factor (sigma-70 family)
MTNWLHNLFERHAGEINRFLRRQGHNVETAADLTQDTFVRILSSSNESEIGNPRALLHRVAKNLSIDVARRERHVRRVDLTALAFDALPDLSPNAETIVSDRERLNAAQEFIRALPDRTRYAFEAHRMGQKTISEIADELDLSTTRTWCLIRNAYLDLKRHVDGIDE